MRLRKALKYRNMLIFSKVLVVILALTILVGSAYSFRFGTLDLQGSVNLIVSEPAYDEICCADYPYCEYCAEYLLYGNFCEDYPYCDCEPIRYDIAESESEDEHEYEREVEYAQPPYDVYDEYESYLDYNDAEHEHDLLDTPDVSVDYSSAEHDVYGSSYYSDGRSID
jgi:hypothetical protein